MSAYEIMLSESQERMLLVAEKGREDEVLRVFAKWGLDAVIVGTVEPEPRLRIRHHGELVADIPNHSLTDDAPLYHRPVGTWKAPVPLDPPAEVARRTGQRSRLHCRPQETSRLLERLLQALGSRAIRHHGADQHRAGPRRRSRRDAHQGHRNVRDHERGLAMALDGNGRWAYLDPKLGAMHAVAEAARKVACTGATPVAATNCLNFGNPEKPEIMAQLSAAIDGIAEACTALGTPITGGNVSLYNETRGEGIYPTPVLGIVGILEDVTKAVPAHFQREKDAIVLLWPIPRGEEPDPKLKVPLNPPPISQYPLPALEREPRGRAEADATDAEAAANLTAFGSSEFAKVVLGGLWGRPPALDLDAEASLHNLLAVLAWRKLIRSARDISDGGIAVALAQAAFPKGIGATVEQDPSLLAHPLFGLFAEPASTILVTAEPGNLSEIDAHGRPVQLPLRAHRHHRRQPP